MGNEYRLPIRVNANDPLCSASAIGTTVVGILFEKTGTEIRGAITVRIGLIQTKIASYQSVYEKIDAFLEEKRKSLKELDEFLDARRIEREATLRPFRRQVEELTNKWRDISFDFDKVTERDLGKKAVVFDDGFEAFKPSFTELDEFLKQEQDIVGTGVSGYSGSSGYAGSSGSLGVTGTTGQTGSANSNGIYYTNNGSSITVDSDDDTSEEEDKAAAKVEHLRWLIQSYANKLEQLKSAIKQLQEEDRRLALISRNVDADRSYKLDMNKLSAFGFEDLA